MITSERVKEAVIRIGADRCGIAPAARFSGAPEGFKPTDIYPECRSVIVFLRQMPAEIIMAANPVPYSHTAHLLYDELDRIGLSLCGFLHKRNVAAIPVPTDTPYLHWEAENQRGQGILSLRHAAYLAGLGFLGRNTLLINEDLGNMAYIGAVLTDCELAPDPLVEGFACPPNCGICLDACPPGALDGITVDQKLCRQVSCLIHERGFDIYNCNECRKSCVLRTGKKHKVSHARWM